MSDVAYVQMMLGGHEDHINTIHQLDAGQRRHAHVQEHAKQHSQRHLTQDGTHHHGDPWWQRKETVDY